MACAPCAAAQAAANAGYQQDLRGNNQQSPNLDCNITQALLLSWKNALLCIKANKKYELINVTKVAINQIAGVVQSAINYPDNYCYFYEQLDYFRTTMLPLIVANVPECLS